MAALDAILLLALWTENYGDVQVGMCTQQLYLLTGPV